jgi:HK97 gp10 family phage protein
VARKNEIKGMKELERTIKKLGNLPQNVVTKGAKAGANIALKSAKKNAPKRTGNLRKGITLHGEKLKVKGRKYYQVVVDPKGTMNSTFVKKSADGKTRYYYPASQEYGYMTVDGRYIHGKRYLSKSLDENDEAIRKKMIDVMGKEIDKVLK